MDINSILNQAGGVSAIARELGVDESTVESGTGALLPQVANGIETQASQGDAAADPQVVEPAHGGASGHLGGLLGGLLGAGGSGDGLMGAGGSGGILGSLVGGGVGNQVLGHIFGSKDASRDVAAQASQQSGIDSSILKKLLPIVAGAAAMHYMTHRGQGSTMADADAPASGGILGSILGNR